MWGEPLTESERARRMSATGGGPYPKLWPRAFYCGELTECRWSKLVLHPVRQRQVMFDGEMQDMMKLVLEATSGIALHDKWFVKPFNCGDSACINPHHWRVVRYPGSVSPQLPTRPGFIQLASDGLREIERILANCRYAEEPTRIIHRSHPHLMYSHIEAARRFMQSRTHPRNTSTSDSTI